LISFLGLMIAMLLFALLIGLGARSVGGLKALSLLTVKPSGTLSLLGGATPGVHPAFSQYYMRTVRMSSSDALVQICKDMGYHVEFLVNFDGTENRDTVVSLFSMQNTRRINLG